MERKQKLLEKQNKKYHLTKNMANLLTIKICNYEKKQVQCKILISQIMFSNRKTSTIKWPIV